MVANTWIDGESSADKWKVYSKQVENVLSLRLSSIRSTPDNPMTMAIVETVVSGVEIKRIYEEIWPVILGRLTGDSTGGAARSAITAAEHWLQIGRGFDMPFGRSHPQASIDAAYEYGRKLLTDLSAIMQGSAGLGAYLEQVAKRFDVPIDLAISPDAAAFFISLDLADDVRQSLEDLQLQISAVVNGWGDMPPKDVIARLRDLRNQLELSPVRWPDRIAMACQTIATTKASTIEEWIDAAAEGDLFPHAAPFVVSACQAGKELGDARIRTLLENPRSRGSVLEAVLTIGMERDRKQVIWALTGEDYWVIRGLLIPAASVAG